MDQGTPRNLMSVYVAAVIIVGLLIGIGSYAFWHISGRNGEASSSETPG